MADNTVVIVGTNPRGGPFGSLDGNILTVLNTELGNANTSYTYVGMFKDGINLFTLQWVITATTLTFEFSNDLPSVADASAVWTDLTTLLTGAATVTATGSLTVSAPLCWSRMRIKRLTTNATNALKLIMTRVRLE